MSCVTKHVVYRNTPYGIKKIMQEILLAVISIIEHTPAGAVQIF
jgi:hypothetical protein